MIRYTLACDAGHGFESWFPSGDAYDDQHARGLITCPLCDSRKVGKAPMAPALSKAAAAAVSAAPEPPSVLPGGDRAMRALLRAMHGHIRQTADDVGPRFATEARAMHLGERPHRAIYGQATHDEARTLADEGVPVCPLPPMPDDHN